MLVRIDLHACSLPVVAVLVALLASSACGPQGGRVEAGIRKEIISYFTKGLD